MGRDEVVMALERRPFQPFFVHVTDGKRYRIESPFAMLVTSTAVVIGCDVELNTLGYPVIDHFSVVDLLHVTRIEPDRDLDLGNGAF